MTSSGQVTHYREGDRETCGSLESAAAMESMRQAQVDTLEETKDELRRMQEQCDGVREERERLQSELEHRRATESEQPSGEWMRRRRENRRKSVCESFRNGGGTVVEDGVRRGLFSAGRMRHRRERVHVCMCFRFQSTRRMEPSRRMRVMK